MHLVRKGTFSRGSSVLCTHWLSVNKCDYKSKDLCVDYNVRMTGEVRFLHCMVIQADESKSVLELGMWLI